MSQIKIPIYLSGTSRIAVFQSEWLEGTESLSGEASLTLATRIFNKTTCLGTPTNKIAVVHPIKQRDYVQVSFLQYIPESGKLDVTGNCGNAMIGAFVYLLGQGLVRSTAVFESMNTGQRVSLHEASSGDDGISYVRMEYLNPVGAITQKLLPTGTPTNLLAVGGEQSLEVSILDAGNPYIWIRGEELRRRGLKEWEGEEFTELMRIRQSCQHMLGLSPDSVFPKVALVTQGDGNECDLAVRMISVPTWHKSFAMTGIVNLCASALCPGNIVHEMLQRTVTGDRMFRLSVQTPSRLIRALAFTDPVGDLASVQIEQQVQILGVIEIDAHLRIAI